MKSRTGLMNSFVVGIIVVLIAFFMVFFLAIKMGYMANQDADTNICRVTLAAQDMSKVGTGFLSKDSPLGSACKRRTVNIVDEGITVVNKGPDARLPVYLKQGTTLASTTKYDLKGEQTQEVLANYFAGSMSRCWLRGLEGNIEVFNDRSMVSTQTVCMLCDETHVELTSNAPVKGAWLTTYLTGTKMPGNKDQLTYGEYLFNIKGGISKNQFLAWGNSFNWREMLIFGLPGKDGYSLTGQTICVTEKGIEMNPEIHDGSYATVFFRDFSKKNYGCMAVVVVPAQQVRRLCDYVAN